jgi:hypothetical protein
MIPGRYMRVEGIPLTSNGKVDRKQLPLPSEENIPENYEEPQGETAVKLSEIWKELLGYRRIGMGDDLLELGAHSLTIGAFVNRVHRELNVVMGLREVFENPTLRSITELVERSRKQVFRPIEPVAVQEHYALSHAQERLWILHQFEERQTAFNLSAFYSFNGDIDQQAFEDAFAALVERHEILRTVFITVNEEPRQKILPYDKNRFGIKYSKLNHEEEPGIQLRRISAIEGTRYFDFEKGPLYSALMLQQGEQNIAFLFTLHHIIFDGWSATIIRNEFQTLYEAFCAKKQNPLSPLRIQYKDYAAWQNSQQTDEMLKKNHAFWMDSLSGDLPVLKMKTDFPRPEVKTYNGAMIRFIIPENYRQSLIAAGTKNGTSLFITLVAVVKLLLYRYTGQQDLIVGTTVANREHEELENQVGFYVNMLALRTRFRGNESFPAFLAMVNNSVLNAYEHQAYPFDRLIKELNIKRNVDRFPLFDVLVEFAAGAPHSEESALITDGEIHDNIAATQYDLSFRFTDLRDRLLVNLEYNTDLYKEESVWQLQAKFLNILEKIIAGPGIMIDDELLSGDSEQPHVHTEKLKNVFNVSAFD